MDALDKVLKLAKANPGTQYPFCACTIGKEIVAVGSIKPKTKPKSLQGEPLKKPYVAWGHVVWKDDDVVTFICQKLVRGAFPAAKVKALSPLLKKPPVITKGGDAEADEGGFKDALEDQEEDAEFEGNEKPVVFWEKNLDQALRMAELSDHWINQLNGVKKNYEVAFPGYMLEALAEAGKEAFVQQVIDNLNARLKDDAVRIKKVFQSDLSDDKKAAGFDKIKSALDAHMAEIVDKSWERFVSAFDVPGKWKQRMQKSVSVGVPAVGFAAGIAGVATAPVGLTAVVIIPSAIAALRSAAAGAEACKVYLGSVKMASESLSKSAEALRDSLGVAKEEITNKEGGVANVKAVANALVGAGVAATIKTVRDEIEALNNRVTQSEKVRDKALAPILTSVNLATKLHTRLEADIDAHEKADAPDAALIKNLKDSLAMCEASGAKISESLDKVIDQNKKIAAARTKIDKARDIVDAMEKRIKAGLDKLEVVENGARAIVGISLGLVNGALGAASSSGDALSVIVTTSGGLADAVGGAQDTYAVLAKQ